jgi:dihydroorotase-like cyclic amidohydrolase
VLDLRAEWKYTADSILSLSRNSPFLGRTMRGRVSAALLGDKLFRS